MSAQNMISRTINSILLNPNSMSFDEQPSFSSKVLGFQNIFSFWKLLLALLLSSRNLDSSRKNAERLIKIDYNVLKMAFFFCIVLMHLCI